MLRMTIGFSDTVATIGINGVQSFFAAFGCKELDTIQEITEDFIEKVKSMETYDWGFTESYKEKFVSAFETRKGQKCLLLDLFLTNVKGELAESVMQSAKLANEGKLLIP